MDEPYTSGLDKMLLTLREMRLSMDLQKENNDIFDS
jgi:hypothetical protein